MTDCNKWEIPGCPVSFRVHMGSCPEPLEPRKYLEVGSIIPLTAQWPAPDSLLAGFSERLATMLYGFGVRWRNRWGQWRLDSLETKAKVIRDDATGLELRTISGGVVTQDYRGTYAEIEGVDD